MRRVDFQYRLAWDSRMVTELDSVWLPLHCTRSPRPRRVGTQFLDMQSCIPFRQRQLKDDTETGRRCDSRPLRLREAYIQDKLLEDIVPFMN